MLCLYCSLLGYDLYRSAGSAYQLPASSRRTESDYEPKTTTCLLFLKSVWFKALSVGSFKFEMREVQEMWVRGFLS